MCGGVVDIWVLHLVFDVSAERTTIHFNMPTQSNNLTKYNNRKYINCLIRSTFAVLSTFALCKLAIFSSLRSLFCFPFIRQTLTVPSYIYSLFVCLLFRAAQAHIFFAGLEKYRFIWCLFLGFAFQSNSILYFSFPIGKYWFFAVWWCVFLSICFLMKVFLQIYWFSTGCRTDWKQNMRNEIFWLGSIRIIANGAIIPFDRPLWFCTKFSMNFNM